jgi:hypothetical protein
MKLQTIVALSFFLLITSGTIAQVYEYKIVTTVESIVPNGLGRSRMISANDSRD